MMTLTCLDPRVVKMEADNDGLSAGSFQIESDADVRLARPGPLLE